MCLLIVKDNADRYKLDAFEIHLDVSEIYFGCNSNAFIHGLDSVVVLQTESIWIHLNTNKTAS